MTPERSIVLFGTAEAPASPIALSTFPLAAELFDGGVRTLAWRGVEILRRVAFLIRDTSWGTPTPVLTEPVIEATSDTVVVRWSGKVEVASSTFAFDAAVAMEAGGRLSFDVMGAPSADLAVNRAGFVLLHPADFAGLPVAIEHVDDDGFVVLLARAVRRLDCDVGDVAVTAAKVAEVLLHRLAHLDAGLRQQRAQE